MPQLSPLELRAACVALANQNPESYYSAAEKQAVIAALRAEFPELQQINSASTKSTDHQLIELLVTKQSPEYGAHKEANAEYHRKYSNKPLNWIKSFTSEENRGLIAVLMGCAALPVFGAMAGMTIAGVMVMGATIGISAFLGSIAIHQKTSQLLGHFEHQAIHAAQMMDDACQKIIAQPENLARLNILQKAVAQIQQLEASLEQANTQQQHQAEQLDRLLTAAHKAEQYGIERLELPDNWHENLADSVATMDNQIASILADRGNATIENIVRNGRVARLELDGAAPAAAAIPVVAEQPNQQRLILRQ